MQKQMMRSALTLLAGALLLLASPMAHAADREIRDLVEDLKDPALYLQAAQALVECDAGEVILILSTAIQQDEIMNAQEWSLYRAYEVLSRVGEVGGNGAVRFANRVQVDTLLIGAHSRSKSVRMLAARALPHVTAPYQREAVAALRLRLSDPEVEVVRSSAISLGKMGPVAAPAFDDLKRLTLNPKPRDARKWRRVRNKDYRQGSVDPEVALRSAAMWARLSISDDAASDLAGRGTLDRRGQQALGLAVLSYSGSASGELDRLGFFQRDAVEILTGMAADARTVGEHRIDATSVLGLVARSERTESATRDTAIESIVELSELEDDAVGSAANSILERLVPEDKERKEGGK